MPRSCALSYSGVIRYGATPSAGTVALMSPADDMSYVVWPPTTTDWPAQRSCTSYPLGSGGSPIAAAVVAMATGPELSLVVVLKSPTITSPFGSTLANTWLPALPPGVPDDEISEASIASWSTPMTCLFVRRLKSVGSSAALVP